MKIRMMIVLALAMLAVSACVVEPIGGGRGYYGGGHGYYDGGHGPYGGGHGPYGGGHGPYGGGHERGVWRG